MSAQCIVEGAESPRRNEAVCRSHWANRIAVIRGLCDMTPRNRGPTTFAMSAVGTQPAFARTRSFESEMRAQRLSEAIKLRGLFHPRHSRFSSCATAASARSAGPPSPARSPHRVRCCMGRPYKSRAASRCLGSAKMCSRRLTSVSDAMDGALRGIKVPKVGRANR